MVWGVGVNIFGVSVRGSSGFRVGGLVFGRKMIRSLGRICR